jgi:uncharacterized protein YbbK (DUF523 family)
MKTKILISGCLFGENCRYDGKNSFLETSLFEQLNQRYTLIPFCPEVEGGLPTPRIPSEIQTQTSTLKLLNAQGEETTHYFVKGAQKALELIQKEEIRIAILKSKSPSCSIEKVYDGSFSKQLVEGRGVTGQLLFEHDIELYDEHSLKELL